MIRTILCVLVAVAGLAKEPESIQRPVCRAEIRGRFWPSAANKDVKAAVKLSRCGALEMCTTKGWKFQWQSVTVNVRQLGKTPQEPTPACVAVVEEFSHNEPLVTAIGSR